MQTINYDSAAEFLAKAQPILEQDEVINNVILGVCLRMARYPERVKIAPYLAVVEDENEVKLVAMMTPPNLLILYNPGPDYAAALENLATDLQEKGWKVPGIVSPSPLAQAFAETWTKLTGIPHHDKMLQCVYKLTEVIPPRPVPGHLRLATEADIDLVAQWAFAFSEEAMPGMNREEAQAMAKTRIQDREIFIWEDGGQPVSMAQKSRTTRNGATVSLVYTPPELRGRGYASACVAAMSQRFLDEGYKFTNLFTDLGNPTSNAIYQKIGYRPVCDFTEYLF